MSGVLKPMYRMPTSFGPAPGPRNLPVQHSARRFEKDITTLSVSALTDAEQLARLMPNGFVLRGEPRLHISLMILKNIGWLAGRGYNILMVRVPARWEGQERVEGDYVPVLWESMADPIVTGREELGWSKIYASIPDLTTVDGRWRGEAIWEGYRFFEIEAEAFAAREGTSDPAPPMLFQKYVPRTGMWGEPDAAYATATAPDGPQPEIHSVERGTGHFTFRSARWEDMPTQYPIVNALAALPLSDFGPATLVKSSGGGDGSAQRILT